jgi:hypothetical protein
VRRRLAIGGGAIVALVGLVVGAALVIGQRDPVGWLDQNLERTDRHAWLSQDPPMTTAQRLADAVDPASMVVSSWGIALRYAGGTVTVVAGPREGTASVYWDASARRYRHYRFGRYRWWSDAGGPAPAPDGRASGQGTFTPLAAADAAVQTRRGEDFRGGGPGGGK